MSAHSNASPRDVSETVSDLRKRLGLFSFRQSTPTSESAPRDGRCLDFELRPGSVVEWLTGAPGAGVVACAMQMMSQLPSKAGIVAIVDASRECHAPALSGWGVSPSRTLLVHPSTPREACWAVEQCLRCPGVSAVWAWVDRQFSTHVHRRWQAAAEVGGGVGVFFRPEAARREPAWTDLRVLVTPMAGGPGETRRVRINILYRRGGLGGTAQVWEIDHAEGVVRLVPEVADSEVAERVAGA